MKCEKGHLACIFTICRQTAILKCVHWQSRPLLSDACAWTSLFLLPRHRHRLACISRLTCAHCSGLTSLDNTQTHIFVRSIVTKQHFVCFAARPRLAVHISSGNLGRVLTSAHRHTSLQCETSSSFSVATLPEAYRKMDVSCTALKDCPSSLTVPRYAPHIGADMSGCECFLSHVLYLGCVLACRLQASTCGPGDSAHFGTRQAMDAIAVSQMTFFQWPHCTVWSLAFALWRGADCVRGLLV